MGFSVSVSTLLIFLGIMLAAGPLYGAWTYTQEELSDADDAALNDLMEKKVTQIDITGTTYTGSTYSAEVVNNGSAGVNVSRTTLLLDGELSSADKAVKGSTGSGLWLPGDTLVINATTSTQPNRAKVVTPNGVSDTVIE